MVNLSTAKECPRLAFLQDAFPAGRTKHFALRGIMRSVLKQINYAKLPSGKKVTELVHKAFEDAYGEEMLSFEAAGEERRMDFYIQRYINFERAQAAGGKTKVLSADFANKVTFNGEKHSASAHLLIDRGDERYYEVIRFKYKSPEYSSGAKLQERQPHNSYELLMLQKAGEAEMKKLVKAGKCKSKHIFACIYYLKSSNDKGDNLDMTFEERPERNIISVNFTHDRNIIKYLKGAAADPKGEPCDPKKCESCYMNDLCNSIFVKRSLTKQEKLPEKRIDEINLTYAQQEFVNFTSGKCRVNAVAGSGKTTVVTLRTLAMLEDGALPEEILMVTFTDKACGEMRERLKAYAHGAAIAEEHLDVESLHVETFNSWGQGLLVQHYASLGFTAPPEIVDDITKKDIIIKLLEDFSDLPLEYRNPFMSTKYYKGAVCAMEEIVDSLKAFHVETPADVAKALSGKKLYSKGFNDVVAQKYLEFYNQYNETLVSVNKIDYEDQLRLLLKLKDQGVFATLPYKHIICDEFQDSNPNQIDIILEIMKARDIESLVVVGDDMQAIYSFRNATPDNLINFNSHFTDMSDIYLEDNFRSDRPIVDMANRIIKKESKLAKVIRAHKEGTGLKPALRVITGPDSETNLFVKQAKVLIGRGEAPSSIAVLCRTKMELLKIQTAMEVEGIPTILKVPENICDSPYVKAIISLAEFFRNNEDLASLALYAKSLGQDPFDVDGLKESAKVLLDCLAIKTTEGGKIEFFFGLLKDAEDDYVAAEFIKGMKSRNFHRFKDYLNYCAKYARYETKEQISTSREETDSVQLITIHSAKGLEWPTVLLSLKKFAVGNEEENRLLYVAVTRAKEKLLVSYTEKQEALIELLQ